MCARTHAPRRNGICVRHFGRLREKCENSYPRKILLSDMIARVIKVMLRRFFREKMRFVLHFFVIGHFAPCHLR
jgi:hypothetical protein